MTNREELITQIDQYLSGDIDPTRSTMHVTSELLAKCRNYLSTPLPDDVAEIVKWLNDQTLIFQYGARKKATDMLERLWREKEASEAIIRQSQKELEHYQRAYRGCCECEKELEQRIKELTEELENERASGIHSCHPACKRPLCVAQRRVKELEGENDDLHSKLKALAPEDYA